MGHHVSKESHLSLTSNPGGLSGTQQLGKETNEGRTFQAAMAGREGGREGGRDWGFLRFRCHLFLPSDKVPDDTYYCPVHISSLTYLQTS